MISLNNLNYHKKINDYINKIFDITPKEMMECFGELIDNFTGNGITKNGNVKIDEKGIASYFVNNTD